MPQFIMKDDDSPAFTALDAFTQAYITAAFFTEANPDNEEMADKGFLDLAPETLKDMIEDCRKFALQNHKLIEYELERQTQPTRPLSVRSAGHDFWLTRNNHGAGFWDGDWSHYGEVLTEACKAFGEFNLYVGDDGKIYATG